MSGYLTGRRLSDLVEARAAATPDALFVVDERRRRMTFGEFRDAVARTAAGFAAQGVGEGTVVSWQLPSWIETMVLTAALSRLGAVQNPLIMMLREPEVEFICRQAGSTLLIVPEEFRGFAHGDMARTLAKNLPGLDVLVTDGTLPQGDPAALAAEPEGPEVRWIFYTSGTTSDPKGARHTDAGLAAAAVIYSERIPLTVEDRVATLAPIAHVGGVLHLMTALMSGAAMIINDVFEPGASARLLSEEGVTCGGSGVPFAQALLREQRARPGERLFPRMKVFTMGGAPRPASLHAQVRDELGGVGIASGYGLTECPYFSWADPRAGDEEMATTEGRPGLGARARIVREDGTEAPPGEPGELRVKAPQMMLGYVDSALDAEAFDEDGWFRTGDIGFLDAAGRLTIAGRLKDVIIRNMENISAREVEEHLLALPGVRDATVIGLPDPMTGERVCAVIAPEDPAAPPSLEELSTALRRNGLNPRKLPAQLEILPDVPRNAMGKVNKSALARRFTT